MINTVRINSFDFRGSTCDGPGIRNVIFFQGCNRHCPGCHNPSTWAIDAGWEVDIDILIKIIIVNTPMRKITISGGEPLLQLQGLIALTRKLHQKDFNLAVYTGENLDEVPRLLLSYIDYIKIGEFRQNLQTSVKPYIGSSNQRFIKLH